VFLVTKPQPDCASAWLEAVNAVDAQPGHEAHNVLIDVADPTAAASLAHPVVARVEEFLSERGKSVETIANTIFPQAIYERYGYPDFIEKFYTRVLPKVRNNKRWSGYYFERMTKMPLVGGGTLDQLSREIGRMRENSSLNKHEVTVFDPERDVTDSVYAGQCLSFLSFHLVPGTPRTVLLTVQYRNHYYVEKLLGNLIGLGRLMAFVARETGTKVGALTVLSTHAQIDTPKATRQDIKALRQRCSEPSAIAKTAA
jgi:thymidylate synthase